MLTPLTHSSCPLKNSTLTPLTKERLSSVRKKKGERGIWQRRFWEHTIRDERDYMAHVDYVHLNPLKHGLVSQVKDWPYSSFHRYVQDGVYPVDWAGEVTEMAAGERE
jgi:putative transposase